jgi:hypothetical protein
MLTVLRRSCVSRVPPSGQLRSDEFPQDATRDGNTEVVDCLVSQRPLFFLLLLGRTPILVHVARI